MSARRSPELSLSTGLIVGTLDIISAFIIALSRGLRSSGVLQFIASGLLGRSAFQGGAWPPPRLGSPCISSSPSTLAAVFYASTAGN